MLKLKGLIVPIATPRIDSSVDIDSLKNLINYLIKAQVDSIFILGTTGEFQYLNLEQKKEVIINSINSAEKRIPVLTGVSAYTRDETLELMNFSRKADAIVVTPMFAKQDPEKALNFAIENSSLPIMIYNIPLVHDNKNLSLGIIEKFSKNPRIIGIKDSSGDWDRFKELLKLQTGTFKVLQGEERLVLDSLNNGASGIVAGSANFAPKLFKDLCETKNPALMQKVLEIKKEYSNLSLKEIIQRIKQKTADLGIIKSSELWC